MTTFFRGLFSNYTGIFTQSELDREKFIKIGAPADKTEVMKNLKFDVKKINSDFDLGQNNFRVIIAGSTHKGEDEIILETFKKLKSEFPDIKLLLAPRHLTRVNNIKELVERTGLTFGLRSQDDKFYTNDVIILDTLGELSRIYQICDFAFIGGSFNNTGGHNPLEAVVYNKPVISGPSIHNFRDIYWILSRTEAGKIVKNQIELYNHMHKLLSDRDFYKKSCEDCKDVFTSQQGALEFVIEKLKTTI